MDQQEIRVINRITGLVEKSFIIYEYFDRFLLYLEKFILTFKSETRLVKSYSLKGEFLCEITLPERLKSHFHTLNKEFCFLSDEKKFVFFKFLF